MIEAKSISCSAPILRDVNIDLNSGKLTGIVGPNGAGKTTLLKMLAGLLKPESGQLSLDGKSFDLFKSTERARRIAYLEQYSFVHWPLSVEQLVRLGRFPHKDSIDNSPENDRAVVRRVMQQVGIQGLSARTFNSLSGGERARVLLARALTVQADHLLVDEPIASLDLKYQFEIMELLSNQTTDSTSVCVILHDLNLAVKYCDFIHLMYKGKVISHGKPEQVLTQENIKATFDINARVIQHTNGIEIYPLA